MKEVLIVFGFFAVMFVLSGVIPAIAALIPAWVMASFLIGVCAWLFWYAIRPERGR